MFWLIVISSLYFFLPAYLANMFPSLAKNVPFLRFPVWEKKLGKNKTWRGVFIATLTGGLVFWLQKLVYAKGFTAWAIIDYSGFSIVLGFLMGFGAIFGDLVESYYKRKIGIAPGKPWMPFDQLDFVIGALVLSFFIYVPPVSIVLILIIASPLLHLIFNRFGYWLKIQQNKY
jgi:CDP-2,3-bis-(O-geranylgeranyl)-sn-glycerol synthase